MKTNQSKFTFSITIASFFNYDRAVRTHCGAHSAANAFFVVGADGGEISLAVALLLLKLNNILGTGCGAKSTALAFLKVDCNFCHIQISFRYSFSILYN